MIGGPNIVEIRSCLRDTNPGIIVTLEGHPTDCLQKALEIGQVVLGNSPWRVILANYVCPLSYMLETEGMLVCEMRVKSAF
jgi:hypothetical protein